MTNLILYTNQRRSHANSPNIEESFFAAWTKYTRDPAVSAPIFNETCTQTIGNPEDGGSIRHLAGMASTSPSRGNGTAPSPDMAVESRWASLMRAARSGDEIAYRMLLRELAPALRVVLRRRSPRYGLSAADVDDAVQETLLAIHLNRDTWRDDRPFRPWAFAIARYKLADLARRRYRRAEHDIADYSESLVADADADPTIASDMDRVIARLKGRAGDVVRAIGMEGNSIADTARRFGMSEGAVRVALHRGLRRLADIRTEMTG